MDMKDYKDFLNKTDIPTDELLQLSRSLIAERFPGIGEAEAIAYGRGMAKGLAMAGIKGEKARQMMFLEVLSDKMLGAGASYTTQNLIESMSKGKQ